MKDETRVRLLVWRPPFGGLLGALILFAASMTPSLLPRPWYLQGAVSGVAIALGYGLGSALGALVRSVSRGRSSPTVDRLVQLSLLLPALALVVWAAIVHFGWQVDVRRLMDMEPGVGVYQLGAILTAVAVGYILVVAARLTRRAWGGYVRLLQRKIDWETMGRQGRVFVAEAPDRQQLEDFNGEAGLEPIRVYAGLQTADTAAGRAEMAVAELERIGAFEREILWLVAPTGTGWIDPYAVSPLEYTSNSRPGACRRTESRRPLAYCCVQSRSASIRWKSPDLPPPSGV